MTPTRARTAPSRTSTAAAAAPSRGLVDAVLAGGICGQGAAFLVGALPLWGLAVSAPLLLVLAFVALHAGAATVARLRLAVTAVAGLAALFALGGALAPRVLAPAADPRALLAPLVVALQVLQAATWQLRRDLQTGLLVAVGLLVLAASYDPDLVGGVPLVLGWAACTAAGVRLVAEHRSAGADLVAVADRPRPPLWPAVALALVLGLAAFLLVPVPRSPALGPGSGGTGGAGGAAGDASSARTRSLSSPFLDLSARGALGDGRVAEVPADSPLRWRSQVFPSYDGAAWTMPDLPSSAVAGPPYAVAPATGAGLRSDRVDLQARDAQVWAPGEPVELDVPVTRDPLGMLRLARPAGSYTVTSLPGETDPERLRAAPAGPVDPAWLQLPATLPARVRALAADLTAGAATRYDAVLAVETFVRGAATYSLASPVPAPGEDAVDRFLFVDHVGFCEQFASAETVLLRAAGIPARLVTGLAFGQDAGAGRRSFRQDDLHAWVEVAYDGIGWAPSDPTPPDLAVRHGDLRARWSAALRSLLGLADALPGGRRTAAAVLLAGAAAGALLRRRRRSAAGRQRGAADQRCAAPPVQAGPALTAFLRLDARLGEQGRRPAESLAEMRDRLGLPAHALGVVEQECYAPSPPEAGAAVEVLDRL